jgi:hypothetical protein
MLTARIVSNRNLFVCVYGVLFLSSVALYCGRVGVRTFEVRSYLRFHHPRLSKLHLLSDVVTEVSMKVFSHADRQPYRYPFPFFGLLVLLRLIAERSLHASSMNDAL